MWQTEILSYMHIFIKLYLVSLPCQLHEQKKNTHELINSWA